MGSIGMNPYVTRAPDAVSRVFDGRAVVISLDAGRIRTLNPTGTAVWEMLASGPRPLAEIVDGVAATFPDESRQAVEADVRTFVADLVARQLATADDR